jgi:hypothetical protein
MISVGQRTIRLVPPPAVTSSARPQRRPRPRRGRVRCNHGSSSGSRPREALTVASPPGQRPFSPHATPASGSIAIRGGQHSPSPPCGTSCAGRYQRRRGQFCHRLVDRLRSALVTTAPSFRRSSLEATTCPPDVTTSSTINRRTSNVHALGELASSVILYAFSYEDGPQAGVQGKRGRDGYTAQLQTRQRVGLGGISKAKCSATALRSEGSPRSGTYRSTRGNLPRTKRELSPQRWHEAIAVASSLFIIEHISYDARVSSQANQ